MQMDFSKYKHSMYNNRVYDFFLSVYDSPSVLKNKTGLWSIENRIVDHLATQERWGHRSQVRRYVFLNNERRAWVSVFHKCLWKHIDTERAHSLGPPVCSIISRTLPGKGKQTRVGNPKAPSPTVKAGLLSSPLLQPSTSTWRWAHIQWADG